MVANLKGALALTNHVLRSVRKTRPGESAVNAVANIATGTKAETADTGATAAIVATAGAVGDPTGVDAAGSSATGSSAANPESGHAKSDQPRQVFTERTDWARAGLRRPRSSVPPQNQAVVDAPGLMIFQGR